MKQKKKWKRFWIQSKKNIENRPIHLFFSWQMRVRFIGMCMAVCFTGYGNAAVPLEHLLALPALKHAAVGICVKETETGHEVANYQAEMALTPASVTKLLPTWLAWHEKGEDFTFETRLFYTGRIEEGVLSGNLIIVPGGDPTLDSRYFPGHSLISFLPETLRKARIMKIEGKIIIEHPVGEKEIPGSWLWEDVSNYYAALYTPFNYRDNTYTLTFSTAEVGRPASLKSIEPALPGIRLVNEVSASAENRDNAWIFGGPYSPELHVKGTIPANRSAFSVKGAMHRPDLFFIKEVTERLKKHGIRIENKDYPSDGRTFLSVLSSPKLSEIVYHTNKSSVNLFAEAAGEVATGGKWTEKAFECLEAQGIQVAGMTLKDACGLSPLNAVPAVVFTDLLVRVAQEKDRVFMRSLPVAGTDAGLNGYCRDFQQLKGRLKAKTGSMSGVRCLSGYLETKGGKTLAFTILINHYTCPVADLQHALSEFLTALQETE